MSVAQAHVTTAKKVKKRAASKCCSFFDFFRRLFFIKKIQNKFYINKITTVRHLFNKKIVI